jgi:hypothetical protein
MRPPTLKDNESVDNAVWSGGIKTISVLKNGAQALWVLVLSVIGELCQDLLLRAWGESGRPPSDGLLFCFWNAKGYVHYLNLIDIGLINSNCIPFCFPGSFIFRRVVSRSNLT